MNNTPSIYTPHWIDRPDELLASLSVELPWTTHEKSAYRECYFNDSTGPELHPGVKGMQSKLETHLQQRMEVGIVKWYPDGMNQLGWHADVRPELDPERAIAIIILGAEREFWFRANMTEATRRVNAQCEDRHDLMGEHEKQVLLAQRQPGKIVLGNGSLYVMPAGMQSTHQYRIPPTDVPTCGPHIHVTFHGYTPVLQGTHREIKHGPR